MNIVITSPIPQGGVGGPASVAGQIRDECTRLGDNVRVVSPTATEMRVPTVVRQAILCLRLLEPIAHADIILALDPVSTGFPATILARIFRKRIILRVGGDFLWETFVERTKESVLLSEFYSKPRKLVMRERIIRMLTRITISQSAAVVFTTQWQRELWATPYGISVTKTRIIANALPEPEHHLEMGNELLALGRDTAVKNIALLLRVWERLRNAYPNVTLTTGTVPAHTYTQALARCRGVIQPSISEVSPNTVLEAIAYGKPFITTTDTGIRDQYRNDGLFVDTRSEDALEHAIVSLLNDSNSFVSHQGAVTRTWKEATQEWRELFVSLLTKQSHISV